MRTWTGAKTQIYLFILGGSCVSKAMFRQQTGATAGHHDSSTSWARCQQMASGSTAPLLKNTSVPLTSYLANATTMAPTAIDKGEKKEPIHKADNHAAKRRPPEEYAESDECFMKRDIAPPICFGSSNFLSSPFKALRASKPPGQYHQREQWRRLR